MPFDLHGITRTKTEPPGCPVRLFPDIAIVEVQNDLVGTRIDAHDAGGQAIGIG